MISILTRNWRQGSSGDMGITLVEAAFPSGGWLLMRTPIFFCVCVGWGESSSGLKGNLSVYNRIYPIRYGMLIKNVMFLVQNSSKMPFKIKLSWFTSCFKTAYNYHFYGILSCHEIK